MASTKPAADGATERTSVGTQLLSRSRTALQRLKALKAASDSIKRQIKPEQGSFAKRVAEEERRSAHVSVN